HRPPRLRVGHLDIERQTLSQSDLPIEQADGLARRQAERVQHGFGIGLELGVDSGSNRLALGHGTPPFTPAYPKRGTLSTQCRESVPKAPEGQHNIAWGVSPRMANPDALSCFSPRRCPQVRAPPA